MQKSPRLPAVLLLGLVILALPSLACQFATNLISGERQPVLQEQQNQQPNQDQGQLPDLNPEQDLGLGDQPDGAAFDLIGIWDSQVETDAGTVSTRLILERTGTFSQTVIWNNLMTLDTGEFNLVGNAVHFTVTHHEPTEYLGKPMTWPTSFTYFVTPIDATSMTVEDHVMNTSWTMYKTGP